jgi:S-adenosylhomocysteine hydrolase
MARNILSQRNGAPNPVSQYKLTKGKKIEVLEDGRVLQSDLSCADNAKHITESIEFRSFHSIIKRI